MIKLNNENNPLIVKYARSGQGQKGAYNFISCEQNNGGTYPEKLKIQAYGTIIDIKSGDSIIITQVPTEIGNPLEKYKTQNGEEKQYKPLTIQVSPSAIKLVTGVEQKQMLTELQPIDNTDDMPF